MKNLADLLRNLLYHAFNAPRQLGKLTATALVAAGISSGTLFANLEHLLHFLITLIGSAVVLNIILRHGNEVLELLIQHQTETHQETRRTIRLVKMLLGLTKEDPEEDTSKNKAAPDDNANHAI